VELTNLANIVIIHFDKKNLNFSAFVFALFSLFMISLIIVTNSTTAFRTSTPNIVIAINPGAFDSKSQSPYNQSKVIVPVGTNVTWINNDRNSHAIVSGDPEKGPSNIFYSPSFGNKHTYTFMFTKPGIYPYYDNYWPHMKGQVEVVESLNHTSNE
jgi:plastocyanin